MERDSDSGAVPQHLSVRMRTRHLQLVFGGTACALSALGTIALGAEVSVADGGSSTIGLLVLFAAFGLLLFRLTMRALLRGLDAGPSGVVVTNVFRRYRLRWHEVVRVDYEPVENSIGLAVHHRLSIVTPDGVVMVDGVGGGTEPGGRLDRTRTDLLRMRDQALVREGSSGLDGERGEGMHLDPSTGAMSYWDGQKWRDPSEILGELDRDGPDPAEGQQQAR